MIFQSKYGDIYYQLEGNENSPVIVFIHGVGMDHRTFEKQVDAFKSSFGTLVWDLPGHGSSTYHENGKRFTQMAADCLYDLLNLLDIDEVILVGQSLGSIIVQHFQVKYPLYVLASVHVPGIEISSSMGSWTKLFVPLMMGMFKVFPSKPFYRLFGKHRAVNEEVQEYLSRAIEKTGKKLVLRVTKDMVYDIIEELPKPPKRPTLYTYGEKDLFFIRREAKKWHLREPTSQCVEIKDANHIANQDNPDVFNLALSEFINSKY
ncbi:MAG: 3-oxoadipate enol-lactonase 2 [Bacteroidetes bacterium HGW-Bacteroidetes-12]|nr:MAG: 3-oxoadipate enol-lactonase 2 [Bacteroidetes bacterium HGW-Bacteroidetes-12]